MPGPPYSDAGILNGSDMDTRLCHTTAPFLLTLAAHCIQPGLILHEASALFLHTSISPFRALPSTRVVAHDCSPDLYAGLIHGKDQSLWKGSFDDIAWHILLLSLTGGERCTTTLSKKGYSRSPLFTSGVLPKLGVWVPHFGNDP